MLIQRILLLPVAAAMITACSIGQPSVPGTPEAQGTATAAANGETNAAPTNAPSFLSVTPIPPGSVSGISPTSQTQARDRQMFTVEQGTVTDQLQFSGRITPVQQSLSFNQDGILAKLYVKPNVTVEQGELLAELELGDLRQQLAQAQVTYEQDNLSLSQAVQAARLEVELAQLELDAANDKLLKIQEPASIDALAQARAEVDQAQSNLDTVRNNASAEKNQAHQALIDAAKNLELVQAVYAAALAGTEVRYSSSDEKSQQKAERAQNGLTSAEADLLAAEDAVARAQIVYDTARGNEIAAVKDAEATLAVARAQLEALTNGADKYDIAEAKREVQRATVAVREAKQRAQPAPELTKRVADSEYRLQQLQEQIETRRLYAPFSGTVAAVNATEGSAVRPATSLITIADMTKTEIVVGNIAGRELGQVEAAQLTIGQPVDIEFSRYAGQVFQGTLTQLPTRGISDAGVATDSGYRIDYQAPNKTLDIGDSAEVTITLGRKYNTLWLPPEAVRTTGEPTVLLKDGDSERRVSVELGIVSSDRIEILAGLKKGDVVFGQ